jgi:diguanylate cyclase (GGDEF)-like protein
MQKTPLIKTLMRRSSEYFTDDLQQKMILAQLFSVVALLLLLLFSIAALTNQNPTHAYVLMTFAVLTFSNYLFLRYTNKVDLANQIIILLMGALCLYLFYTGGVGGTGPLWSFVFIPVAIFLGGIKLGVIAVSLLMLIIMVIFQSWQIEMIDGIYSTTFMIRFVAIYITLAILSFLNEYFRDGSQRHLVSAYQRLELLFRTDDMTGLYNRRHITEQLAYEALRINRTDSPFSLILFDIDHFKQINDRYGHACGDYVLQSVAVIVKSVLRKVDIAARVGGEEFLVLLPDTYLHSAAIAAERLRKAMEQYPFTYGDIQFSVTVSLGVTEASKDLLPDNLDNLVNLADDNLYKAKNRGRNRTVAF